MADDRSTPNQASNKSKPEGGRWKSDPNTVERLDRGSDEHGSDEQMSSNTGEAGITNRPLEEEQANQEAVPPRGRSRPGAHAGHGDNEQEEER